MSLEQRIPGQALVAIAPSPAEPLSVNLFDARLGDVPSRRFDLTRLQRGAPRQAGDRQEPETTS